MAQLFLRFYDETLDGFDWAVVDINAEATEIVWQQSVVSELPLLVSQNPYPVILFVPEQLVFYTEFEVPEKATRQVLASIEYQIEDRLAQDTETQHFAQGTQLANKVPIFVVAQSIMLTIQNLQQAYSLRIQQVLPEMYLCPAPEEGSVALIAGQSGMVLRYGENQSLKCQQEVLASVLDIDCYIDETALPDTLDQDKYPLNIKSLLASELNLDNAINLQQRQFQASSNWKKLYYTWKAVSVAAILLLALGVFNRMIELDDMEQQLAAIKNSQYLLIKDYVGPRITPDSNLKKEMIKLLQNSSSTDQQIDFLHLLLEFSRARQAYSSIDIVKIGYQQDRLSVDISSTQLNDIESLHAALKAKGLTVDLDRLNIKPELVSGQFVVGGANSG